MDGSLPSIGEDVQVSGHDSEIVYFSNSRTQSCKVGAARSSGLNTGDIVTLRSSLLLHYCIEIRRKETAGELILNTWWWRLTCLMTGLLWIVFAAFLNTEWEWFLEIFNLDSDSDWNAG